MGYDGKHCVWVLTSAALFAIRVGPAVKAAEDPTATIVVEEYCPDTRAHITAAPKPESKVERQTLEAPEPQHIDPEPTRLQPAPLPPFVPQDDDWQAVRMRYNQPDPNMMSALLASGVFDDTAILPPEVEESRNRKFVGAFRCALHVPTSSDSCDFCSSSSS